MGSAFVLVEVTPSGMVVTFASDGPEARALYARTQEVCRFAREHVIDTRIAGSEYTDPDPQYVFTAGPLRCTFLHIISPDGVPLRHLSIALTTARKLEEMPSPGACAVVARMFGFTGDMFVDYSAEPTACGCGKLGCEALGITCTQSLLGEN